MWMGGERAQTSQFIRKVNGYGKWRTIRRNSGNRIREFDRIREWTADSLCIGSRAVGCLNFDGTCSWIGVITEIARQRKRIPIFAIAGSSLEIVKLASADHID